MAEAIWTLATIIAEASRGLPQLATTCTPEANAFFLQKEQPGSNADPMEVYIRAFSEATPSFDIEWSGDAGYRASIGYFAFLKTLLLCLVECLNSGQYLLYYSPQP